MQVFGSSGTRGEVGAEFGPEFVLRVARAAATVWDADRVVLARDTRTTGEMFADAAAAGIAATGTDVARLGVAPTPSTVRYCDVTSAPGVQITASHNPPEYNGVKLIGADGSGLPVDRLEAVEECLLSESFDTAAWDAVGDRHRVGDANDDYVAEMLDTVDRDAIADANLTVALDPGHGAGSDTSPEFFRRLGCDVVTVNAQPDGHFPGRAPEPVRENLGDLGRLVRATDADVGIAHDGDADRMRCVAHDGTFLSGDVTLAILAAAATAPGDTVAVPVDTSLAVEDHLADA
ncbi:MAG: phosphoglucosamine mutase, partial [Halobaculum sp.]